MQYNLFGNTGMEVSRLCLGAMTFPNTLEEKASAAVIDEALDKGINMIDTADSYKQSEEVLGRLLRPEKREKVYLTSKVYRRFCRDGRVGANSRVNIMHNIDLSLSKLQTDYLDLYLLHHPDVKTPVEETVSTLDNLVKNGKIRYWGVSNHYSWQMAYMLGLARDRGLEPMCGVQLCYSILERQMEQEIEPMVRKFNLGTMVYSPLAGGVLTGKYHPEQGRAKAEPKRDRQQFLRRLDEQRMAAIIQQLRELARKQDITIEQLAISWVLSKSWASTVLIGASKPEQMSSLYQTADIELPKEVIEEIDQLTQFRVHSAFLNQPMKEGWRVDVNR